MVVTDRAMEHYEILLGVSLKNAVTFSRGFLALLLGAWQLRDNNKAGRELLLQYRNQGGHFARARQQLSQLMDADEHNHILLELGRDSLMESYLWTTHRYHREHEPAGKRPIDCALLCGFLYGRAAALSRPPKRYRCSTRFMNDSRNKSSNRSRCCSIMSNWRCRTRMWWPQLWRITASVPHWDSPIVWCWKWLARRDTFRWERSIGISGSSTMLS